MAKTFHTQDWIHWLEVGEGARWIRLAAAVVATLALSGVVAWKQFHGPTSETTLLQADMGRQIANGAGCTTLVTYPQTVATLKLRGTDYDPGRPYPELSQAPLYAFSIAGILKAYPQAKRRHLFEPTELPQDGFRADYVLLGLNLIFFWTALWLTYDLGSRLFGVGAGWLSALALLLSLPVWKQVVAVNGTPLMMVVVLCAFEAWWRVETAPAFRQAMIPLGLLGLACGALFLGEYSAGTLIFVVAASLVVRFAGRERGMAIGLVLAGFALVAIPWVARNWAVSGNLVGLASQNVALKAGDPTAEPATFRATLSAQPPRLDINKLGNKTLTSIQENLRSRIWSGGALWLAAFFVASWLYAFRAPAVNRLRWWYVIAFFVLLAAQAAFNSGESERWVAVWLVPLTVVFGAGFFFVLLGSHPTLSSWPAVCGAALLVLQSLPLLHDALEPAGWHFQYPPYFPELFQDMRKELANRRALGRFGVMADVPAGAAWYGSMRTWAQPPRLRDFYEIEVEQPVGELLLTPKTLDRPFFSDLNAKPRIPVMLAPLVHPGGEWGEIYAGLLTGNLPGEFPLSAPQKVYDNLYVLLNPALPPPVGK